MMQGSLKHSVRSPVQAGRFYEADPSRLRLQVEQFLADNSKKVLAGEPLALLTPHAGYTYSGRVAGAAFHALAGRPLDRILILGPSHYSDFTGAALPPQQAFATPLGETGIDQQAAAVLLESPCFKVFEAAHATEHSLEVQLPFLQVAVTTPFEIMPLSLGHSPREGLTILVDALGNLIETWREAKQSWVIVASSDTYHGYNAEACLRNDEHLMELIKTMDGEGIEKGMRNREIMACGWMPLALSMMVARKFGARRGVILGRSDSRGENAASGGYAATGAYVVGYVAAAWV